MKIDRILPRSFYARPVLEVAKDCIGKLLVHEIDGTVLAGRIVEAEAYRGPRDRAAHSYRGRRTARTEAMYGDPGLAYIFRIYGLHWHFNLVVHARDKPEAVLIRALEPLAGTAEMAARRGLPAESAELTNGPGKLCAAFGIDGAVYGHDLTLGRRIFLAESTSVPLGSRLRIARSPRVGVDYAGEWAQKLWRFSEFGNRYVSRPQPRP